MGSIEHVEILRRRSLLFRDYAAEALQRGHYDLAAFYAEQALQLRLKSLLLRILGYVPRIHSVRELLGLLYRALRELGREESASALSRFSEDRREALRALDEAYTASRCLPKVYEAADAEKLLAAVGEAFELPDSVERGVFSV
ncbi:MAG: HEPN domain-containing protein [Thermofilaceae archaeon]